MQAPDWRVRDRRVGRGRKINIYIPHDLDERIKELHHRGVQLKMSAICQVALRQACDELDKYGRLLA